MAEVVSDKAKADIARSGHLLAQHSIRTVFDMADEAQASPETVASMLVRMADAHRSAAEVIDKAALSAQLHLKNGKPPAVAP
jgi:hypothetical protein